MQSVLLSPVV